MQFIVLYLSTLVVFAVLDAIMLSNVMKPLFERHIGHLMQSPINVAPASVFYLFYIGGILYLVSLPALGEGSLGKVFLSGAILGGVAYGTYEFTSLSIMKDWSWQMAITDTTWGAFLTGISAMAGVWATRAFA